MKNNFKIFNSSTYNSTLNGLIDFKTMSDFIDKFWNEIVSPLKLNTKVIFIFKLNFESGETRSFKALSAKKENNS